MQVFVKLRGYRVLGGLSNCVGRQAGAQSLAEPGYSTAIFGWFLPQVIDGRTGGHAPDSRFTGHRVLPIVAIRMFGLSRTMD